MKLSQFTAPSPMSEAFVNAVINNRKQVPANTSQISFREDIHEYRNVGNKEVYTSVTTLIHQYQPPFHKEYWTLYKALETIVKTTHSIQIWYSLKNNCKAIISKHLDTYEGQTKACEYLKEWATKNKVAQVFTKQEHLGKQWKKISDDACEKGSAYHLKKENESYSNGFDKIGDRVMNTVFEYSFDLFKLKDGFHTEVLVYSDYYKIAGKVDKLMIETINGERIIHIDDYKTNKAIKKQNPFQSFKYPLSHLDDCNWNVYKLQLSLYAKLLELCGYKVGHLQLTHVTDMGDFPEPFKYMSNEIDLLLQQQEIKLYGV